MEQMSNKIYLLFNDGERINSRSYNSKDITLKPDVYFIMMEKKQSHIYFSTKNSQENYSLG